MKKTLLPGVLILVLAGSGCLKNPRLDQLSTNFVVTTNTDPGTNFSSLRTYTISDSVAYITSSTTDTIIKDANTQRLVDAVKQNMNARGYTYVTRSSNADIGINMALIKDVDVSTIYAGWWTGYPGWWDPWYWGWYYPYYYPWSVTYVVSQGTVIVDMVDLKNAVANNSLKVIWGSVMGGAVGTDLGANVQRGVDAINQAFVQTPVLKAN